MKWFETLTGFSEESPEQVRSNLTAEPPTLTSRINGRVLVCGELETPSLAELRHRVESTQYAASAVSVREVVADVQRLHADESNSDSLFQVASQFNLLEMVGPSITPERGVGVYEDDHTQGPACAVAAGAGTIYRNYFAPVNGRIGQSFDNQIDCLADLCGALGNVQNRLWEMRNGYALASQIGLEEISNQLLASNEKELDALRRLLRVGIQWQTQVTVDDCQHLVSQVYCSALPVAYSRHSPPLWEPFARLILEASYEASICAAILNSVKSGCNQVFLTLLGGGAFGNETAWILGAIRRTLRLYKHAELDVVIVSHGSSKHYIRQLVSDFAG